MGVRDNPLENAQFFGFISKLVEANFALIEKARKLAPDDASSNLEVLAEGMSEGVANLRHAARGRLEHQDSDATMDRATWQIVINGIGALIELGSDPRRINLDIPPELTELTEADRRWGHETEGGG